jgi:hypothetical protein
VAVEVVECYPSPANGGRLRPVPVLMGPDGYGGETVLAEQPTGWDRSDPDVQRTLDWLNGWEPPTDLPRQVLVLPGGRRKVL